jgi:adenylate cyclase
MAAARAIFAALEAANHQRDEDRCIYASIGIGFGRVLHIEGCDLWGDEVNLACKLGEDVAQQGEILLTRAAAAQVSPAELAAEPLSVSVSGLTLPYHRCR